MEKMTLGEFKNRLVSFADEIYPVPADFTVKEEYLNGLAKTDFIKAFSEYRDIISEMYRSAAIKPNEYGFTAINKNTGCESLYDEFSSKITSSDKLLLIHRFINKLCDSSELADNVLKVDMSKLKELIDTFPKIKNPDKLIQRLLEYGFVFPGFDGKIAKTEAMSVEHGENRNIINVMKTFSESKYAKSGIEFDYSHFNHKLFSISKHENLPLTDLYVFNSLSNNAKKFLRDFDDSMNKHGYYYGECPTSGFCWGISQFAYSRAPEKKTDYVCRLYQRADSLVVRLYLNNVAAYSGYIEYAPESIKDAFTNDFGTCRHCKDECKHRKAYKISGREYAKCDGEAFEFFSLDSDSIPYYIDLINLSSKSKKSSFEAT